MDVGLSRHARRRTISLPMWLEDNLGWLTMGSMVVAVAFGSAFFGIGSGEPERPTARSAQAHLAVVLGPLKAFAPGSNDTLQRMSMTVKNLGPAAADNVIVEGLVGASSFRLDGPTTLEVGEQKEYSLSAPVHVPAKSSIVMRYVCWNCPLTPGPAAGAGPKEAVGFERERQELAGE
jgi:hypothetical protein